MQNNNMYTSVKTGLEPTFFGKVMAFFALAIFASAAGTFVTMKYYIHYFVENPGLMWVFFILELGIIFTSRLWSAKAPINRLIFAAFAFITGITIAPLLAVLLATPEGVAVISKALLATGLTFSAAAIFGWTTKMDLSGMRGFLTFGLIGMIIVAIIGFFIPWSSQTEMIYSGAGVLLFAGFITYDFHTLKQYPEDRYIDAALALYLDMFNLFLFILRFITASRD